MIASVPFNEILNEQRNSILGKPLGVNRENLEDISRLKNLPHIIAITGLRRSGKSTLLRQIISRFYGDSNFYYINFEDERLLGVTAADFNLLYESLISLSGGHKTFLIDEIQNIPLFESFVRRFYDNGFKFYITGSSANLLSRELGTKLTGRHLDITMRPFSFTEFLKFTDSGLDFTKRLTTEERARIKNLFGAYLIKGGMPEYLKYDESEILRRTYEDVLIKDIAVRYGINNVKELRELYRYLVANAANKFSYTKLKNTLGFGSVNTVKSYITFLTDTYFAGVINRYDHSIRKQIVSEKKLYVVDNGFIPGISLALTKDRGRLLENLVFNEISKRGEVSFYSDVKSECDFVVLKPGGEPEVYQVCYDLNDENREREFRGLLNAMNEFGLERGTILTYEQESEQRAGNKLISILPVWKWLISK